MSWITGIIGQGIAANIGASGLLGSAQQAQPYSLAQQQANQQAMNMSQGSYNGSPFPTPKWMFNGKLMTFQEFVDLVFPNDTAEKTAFVLKWSE